MFLKDLCSGSLLNIPVWDNKLKHVTDINCDETETKHPWTLWRVVSRYKCYHWESATLIIAQPCTDSYSAVCREAYARLPSLAHQTTGFIYLLPSYNTSGKLTVFQWLYPQSWDISMTLRHVCVYKTLNVSPTNCFQNPFLRACSISKGPSCSLIHFVKHMLANQTIGFIIWLRKQFLVIYAL